MEPPTATIDICPAESWWRSPSSWNCGGVEDSVGMEQHSIMRSCGTHVRAPTKRGSLHPGKYCAFLSAIGKCRDHAEMPVDVAKAGNCYEGVGIWVVHGRGEMLGSAGGTRDLGNLGGLGGVCQH